MGASTRHLLEFLETNAISSSSQPDFFLQRRWHPAYALEPLGSYYPMMKHVVPPGQQLFPAQLLPLRSSYKIDTNADAQGRQTVLIPPPDVPYGKHYWPDLLLPARSRLIEDNNSGTMGTRFQTQTHILPVGKQAWPDPPLHPRVSGHAAQDYEWMTLNTIFQVLTQPLPPGKQYHPVQLLRVNEKMYREILPNMIPLTLANPATNIGLAFGMQFDGSDTITDKSVKQVRLQNLKIK